MASVTIECRDADEADAIRVGLADPVARSMIAMVGILMPLTPKERDEVLAKVCDMYPLTSLK